MRSEWRIKEMKSERAKLSILRVCSLQSKLENKRNTKVDLSIKNDKIENLHKISEQRTLNSLNTLGKFIRRAFELIDSKCKEYLSYIIILLRNSETNN